MTRRLLADRSGSVVPEAPTDGISFVRKNGLWVPENVFGMEWQVTPENTTPLLLTAAFAAYVTMTTTSLVGGVYEIIPFIAATADSQNGQWESRIVVDAQPFGVALFETFGTPNGIRPLTAVIPVPLSAGVHTIAIEARQPGGPGTVSALRGTISLKRAA